MSSLRQRPRLAGPRRSGRRSAGREGGRRAPSAPADAVFRFTAGDAMQTEDDDEDADRSEDYSDDGRASDL